MKKALLLATAAATVLSSSVALAASPAEIDGSLAFQYRANHYDVQRDKDGAKFTIRLNALTHLDQHFDLYARVGAQFLTQAGFASDLADSTKKYDAAVDQFGFVYKNAGTDYKIGRQGVTLGETALLYNTAAYIGDDIFDDGVTITTKVGATDLKVVAVQEDRVSDQDNRLYALQASYKPSKNVKVGGVVAKYDYEDSAEKDTNHWAVNAGYTLGKAGLVGEYTQSNADTDNKAYAIGATYAFSDKDSAYVYMHRTEKNGDIGGWTDFDSGDKGMYYGFDHQMSKDTTFSLLLKDNENVESGVGYNSFRATLTYKF